MAADSTPDPEPQPHAPKGPIKAHRPMPASQPMPRQRCRAHSRARHHGQCKRWAIPGGTVFYWHGGTTPAVVESAKARLSQRFTPALAVYDELLDAKEFPTVRFGVARDIIAHEVGKPADPNGLNVNVTVNIEDIIAI